MKFSEITLQLAKDFCGISGDDSDKIIAACVDASKAYVLTYTGLDTWQADDTAELAVAALIIANEMFTNRLFTVSDATVNPTAKSILDLHCKKLLG